MLIGGGSDNVSSLWSRKCRQYFSLVLFTVVVIVLIATEQFASVEVIKLLLIVEFAMKLEYGDRKGREKMMQEPDAGSGNVSSRM